MKKYGFLKWAVVVLLVAFLASCSTKRPVLYPNVQLKKAGKTVYQGDIDECLRLAEDARLESGEGKKLATQTAGGAFAGAAIGAATGAITGRPGRGAAIGAASGGSGGFMRWLFQSNEVDPVMRRYVEECLREKGYRPIGWH
ncbi:MAG: glycine zipper family protein [Methylococcales bacterium]